jgi:hypothetical protein
MGAVHDRAGGRGGLDVAGAALPGRELAGQPPALLGRALRTPEPLGPTLPGEVVGTGRVIREQAHERL